MRTVAGLAGVHADIGYDAAEPAVADERGERVAAGTEQDGHIVGLILHMVGILAPAGGEPVLRDGLAVEKGLIYTERRTVQAGAAHRPLDGKRAGEPGGRTVGSEPRHAGDPPSGPRRSEKARLEERAAVALDRLAGVRFDTHRPETAGKRAQRRAVVDDLHRLSGKHRAAVPEHAAGLVGDEKLPGFLEPPHLLQRIGKAGTRFVHAERVDFVFGSAVCDLAHKIKPFCTAVAVCCRPQAAEEERLFSV